MAAHDLLTQLTLYDQHLSETPSSANAQRDADTVLYTDASREAHQAVLRDYGLLPFVQDNPANPAHSSADNTAFRNIVNLAANLFHVPIALINIADLEQNCWSSHTKQGCDVIDCQAIDFDVDGSPIPASFCQHVLSTRTLTVSPSTVDDARFANLPSVQGKPHIRFYVGIPLTVPEGITVGSLCVMDVSPHPTPSDNQLVMFQQLAQLAVNELGTQRTLIKQATLERELLERDKTHQLVSRAFLLDIYRHDVDADGNFMRSYGNDDVIMQNLGYTYDDIETRGGWHTFIHPEDMPLVYSHDQRLLAGQDSIVVYRMKTRWDDWCWLEDAATPEWDDSQERIIKVYGTARNISDWKTREQRLLLLESVVVNAKDAVVICDTDSDGDVKYPMRYINQAHREMTGYNSSELLGKSPKLFQGKDTDPETVRRINTALANFETIEDVEILNYGKHGHAYWLELTIVPVADDQGNWQHFVSIQRDITERKHAERRLQASLADKEMLLKEVHHRVKNNLQVMSSLLALQTRRLDDDSAKDALNKSRQRILAMAEVHKMLYEKSDFASFDMAPYLERLTMMLVRGMDAHEVQVVLELEPTLVNIEQAIPLGLIANELITNALKYAYVDCPEPRLTVRLSQHVQDQQRHITLDIIDNGSGMPENTWQHSDSLGMTIVQSMVSQLEATLNMQTHAGTHASVTLSR